MCVPALPMLKDMLASAHPAVVHVALWALYFLEDAALPVLPMIGEALEHTSNFVASEAAGLLESIKAFDETAVKEAVLKALKAINHDSYCHPQVRADLLGLLIDIDVLDA